MDFKSIFAGRMDLPILICLWLLQGSIAAYCAKRKGRNPYLWFAIGCFFGILGIFAIFFLKKQAQTSSPSTQNSPTIPNRKSLPYRSWYYLDEANQQFGPIPTAILENAWEEGRILPSTYVWHEGMENWKTWQEVCQESGISIEKPLVELSSASCNSTN